MKKILIINGHPDSKSFNFAISEAYTKGAKSADADVKQLNIRDLDFEPNLKFGYRIRLELEPDLIDAQEKISWADHIVWIYPIWWYGMPSLMKGFIDRMFLPSFAFKFKRKFPFWEKLLKGRTARIITTANTPYWYYKFFMRSPATNQLKKGILQFSGISPVKTTYLYSIKESSPEKREGWLKKIEKMGARLK